MSYFLAAPAFSAPAKTKDDQTLVQADRMSYDQKTNIIKAIGHVEVIYGNRVLKADKILYYQNKNVVVAKGHVAIMQSSGEVMFADHVELTSDMKDGFIDKVSLLFPDNSRLSAQDAQRYEGRYLVVDRGVYSACDLCAKDPEKPPLWQIKGVRITHDNVAKDVIYRDAYVEFAGVPVFYTPYLSHPDPTVTRRQGFLNPTGGYSQLLGTYGKTPYYIDIAPNSDMVLSPTFSGNDHLDMATEFRHRFSQGEMKWNGSFTNTDLIDEYGKDWGNQWRGNLFGTTLFNLNNEWRAGTDVAFASDKSYLKRYDISSEDVLLNRAFLEGFRGRDYVATNMYYFQDLRPGSQQTEPFVAPEISLSAFGEPKQTFGGRWSLDGGLMVTSRDQSVAPSLRGPDTRRMSFDAGWERQLISSTGFLTNVSGLVRMDGYWADNVHNAISAPGTNFSSIFKIRQFAQSDVTVRYPLGRRGNGYQQLLEPIAVLTAAPDMSINQRLPNEDSLDVEYNETNLFSPNRFTGIDRLEGGLRAAYGLRHTLTGDNGARIEALGGQVFRMKKDPSFPVGSGLDRQVSDYVGRVDFSPGSWLDINYGFRLDSENYNFQRQEIQGSGGVPLFRPFINYLTVRQTEASTGVAETVEEISLGMKSTFEKYWSLFAMHKQAFQPTPGPRLTTMGIGYSDECFQFGVSGRRDYTNRQDLSTGDSVMVHFNLKNIGGINKDTSYNEDLLTPNLYTTTVKPEKNSSMW